MGHKKLFILIAVLSWMSLSGEYAYSQLLEDRNKLKTATKKREGFAPFKKNVAKSKPNQKPDVEKPIKIKGSKETAGNQGKFNIRPRFTPNNGESNRIKVVTRFSDEMAGQNGKSKSPAIRFTQENAGQQGNFKSIPRFTQDQAGYYGKVNISPRFTPKNSTYYGKLQISPRFTQKDMNYYGKNNAAPRFTEKNMNYYGKNNTAPRFTEKNMNYYGKNSAAPRFTEKNMNYYGKNNAAPRFTEKNMNYYGKNNAAPRFTEKNINYYGKNNADPRFTEKNLHYYGVYNVKPRFSENPKYEKTPYVRPRFSEPPSYVKYAASDVKRGFFETSIFHRISFPAVSIDPSSTAIGPLQHKLKKGKHMHPSANYLSAKNNSAFVRDAKRVVNVHWVRAFGNLTEPDGVSEKVPKPKFDKKEREIWNNKEREYTVEK